MEWGCFPAAAALARSSVFVAGLAGCAKAVVSCLLHALSAGSHAIQNVARIYLHTITEVFAWKDGSDFVPSQ